MSYIGSFEKLVSVLGVITLGLIAALLFFATRTAPPVVETEQEAVAEFNPPWANAQPAGGARLDRDALAPLKEAVPVAPARDSGNRWLIQAEPLLNADAARVPNSDLRPGPDTVREPAGQDPPADK